MAKNNYKEEANKLTRLGRYGDSQLVHMSPLEIAMLSRLNPPTRNPKTGLPEFFSLRKMFGVDKISRWAEKAFNPAGLMKAITPGKAGYQTIGEDALAQQLQPW